MSNSINTSWGALNWLVINMLSVPYTMLFMVIPDSSSAILYKTFLYIIELHQKHSFFEKTFSNLSDHILHTIEVTIELFMKKSFQ